MYKSSSRNTSKVNEVKGNINSVTRVITKSLASNVARKATSRAVVRSRSFVIFVAQILTAMKHASHRRGK